MFNYKKKSYEKVSMYDAVTYSYVFNVLCVFKRWWWKNSLSGTEWVTKYADDYLIIKFTSDSKVEGYFADSNFVMDGRLSSGTYTIDGNQVTFNNFIIKYMGSFEYRYTNATISGSAMTVTYYMKHTTSSNWGTAETDNFSKR